MYVMGHGCECRQRETPSSQQLSCLCSHVGNSASETTEEDAAAPPACPQHPLLHYPPLHRRLGAHRRWTRRTWSPGRIDPRQARCLLLLLLFLLRDAQVAHCSPLRHRSSHDHQTQDHQIALRHPRHCHALQLGGRSQQQGLRAHLGSALASLPSPPHLPAAGVPLWMQPCRQRLRVRQRGLV